MITYGRKLICTIGVPIIFALASSGCATRRYVRKQVKPVQEQVTQLETSTNAQFASLTTKHDADIARVDERILSAENKTAENSQRIAQAEAKASEALMAAQGNQNGISANAAAIAALAQQRSEKPQLGLTETGNVTFAFNQSDLSPQAKAALDLMIPKIKANPNSIVELEGFTDETGSNKYNDALSRRRADSVARYLVSNGVNLRGLRILGRGKEQASAELQADFQAVAGNASASDLRMLARRVRIRVYVLE